ncbi:MAG TPA: hypothetical protein VFR97_02005 [Capillimicrobium sp.]|nr:hypothetical protein [Capillimicrobium sp.]
MAEPSRDPMTDRYARGRLKDAEARAALVPLARGERPGAVTVAAILAFVLAIANVAAVASGNDLSQQDGNALPTTIVVTGILLVAAAGMWKVRYWAVLGFQVILGLQIVVLSIALLRVERWWTAVGVVVAIGLLGRLFWKLIRAMARIQMPERPGA